MCDREWFMRVLITKKSYCGCHTAQQFGVWWSERQLFRGKVWTRTCLSPFFSKGVRYFFKDGFRDNSSLEFAYRILLRSPAVAQKLTEFYCKNIDELSVGSLSAFKSAGTTLGLPLQPYLGPRLLRSCCFYVYFLGDPHRLLLAYSLLPPKGCEFHCILLLFQNQF